MQLLRKKTLLRKLFLVALLPALLAGTWTFWWEPSSLVVVHLELAVSPWHPEHAGLKLAVMSDLHVGSPYQSLKALRKLVEVTNAQRPDIVLVLGDFVIQDVAFGRFEDPEKIAQGLSELRAPLGVFAVLGNHDWWFDGERVWTALQSRGIQVLENDAFKVTYGGRSFWIAGIGDLWTHRAHVTTTLQKIEDSEPILAITHNPDVFPEIPDRVSLTLAGHTHGGQVSLPLFGRLKVPSQYGQRFAYGTIEEGKRKLFVTSGVGTSIFPIRFRVPPEVVILELFPTA